MQNYDWEKEKEKEMWWLFIEQSMNLPSEVVKWLKKRRDVVIIHKMIYNVMYFLCNSHPGIEKKCGYS